MPLVPGSTVLLRRRGKVTSAPWLITDEWANPVRGGTEPDAGWRVHDAGGGAVLLESLTVKKRNKDRFLAGRPDHADAWLVPRTTRDGLKWLARPDAAGGLRLECLSKQPGPKYLNLEDEDLVTLVEPPQGRSVGCEFVALPPADGEAFVRAEARGDYSFLVPFGMTRAGGVPGLPKKAKPVKPPWATGPRPRPKTPAKRAKRDPVALELVAALQPSFDDGRHGADCSLYEEPDDPRAFVWPHNVVSLGTVATATGAVHPFGEPLDHAPPRGELARCRKLAAEAAAALAGARPFGGDRPTPFRPFYLVIGRGEAKPGRLTADAVRAAFRGTLYPGTPIKLAPLTGEPFRDDPQWQGIVRWAGRQPEVRHVRYVTIGYAGAQGPNLPAVFPRLILGLTAAGSLVGAAAAVVQA